MSLAPIALLAVFGEGTEMVLFYLESPRRVPLDRTQGAGSPTLAIVGAESVGDRKFAHEVTAIIASVAMARACARLGHPVVDEHLVFAGARLRLNSWLAVAFDLKVFFSVVGKQPAAVTTADVFAFIKTQRAPRRGLKVERQVFQWVAQERAAIGEVVRRLTAARER